MLIVFLKDDLSQENRWKYDIFFKCSEKIVFPNKSDWKIILLAVLSGKMKFPFSKNMILFFRRKMKDDHFQKIHGNMIFSVYMYDVYVTHMILPFCKKKKKKTTKKKKQKKKKKKQK